MNWKRPIVFFVGVISVATLSPVGAADNPRAAMLANACGGCHGTDGASIGDMPAIRGKKAAFIKQSMLDFRDGKRESTVMNRIAKGYTDQEIELLAQYFSSK
jgi:cytochrome subunit of sulfide dehydrogenase